MELYDFRSPIKISREQSRILQIAFETFARQATTVYTSTLRTVCQMTLESVEQRTYGEYIESLDASTYLTVFSAEPMSGLGVIEAPLAATMSAVDHMLGGPGGGDQPDRPLSEIEAVVAGRFTERLLAEMRYSLNSIVPIVPEVTSVEYSPQFAQVAAAGDVMVVVTFDLRIAETEHTVTVCLPFTPLSSFLTAVVRPGAVSDRERAARAAAAQQVQSTFQGVPVDVSVRFRTSHLGPEDLADLQVGDVMRLQHPAAAPLDVVLGDTLFAHVAPGNHGSRMAAQVVAIPSKEN